MRKSHLAKTLRPIVMESTAAGMLIGTWLVEMTMALLEKKCLKG